MLPVETSIGCVCAQTNAIGIN